jgi:hypothetical protein
LAEALGLDDAERADFAVSGRRPRRLRHPQLEGTLS